MKTRNPYPETNEKLNRNKNYQMSRFISLLIGIQGLLMSILTYSDNLITSMVAVSYGLLMLFVFIYTTKSKKVTLFYVTGCIMVLLLELYFLFSGGTEGFGIIWISVLPLFSVYLFNFNSFIVVNSVYFLILVLGMWTPLSQYIYPYSKIFAVRFPLVYLLSFFFGGFLSYRIQKTEQELDHQRLLLSKEINQAAKIQTTFFKPNQNSFSDWSIGYKYLPMSGVSGDLIEVFSTENQLNGFGIFDISGHGISSGLISLLVHTILKTIFEKNKQKDINEIADNVNLSFIKEKGEIENYLTGILAKINNNTIEFVNAGHPEPIIYRKKDDSIDFVKRQPQSVGAFGMNGMLTDYKTQSITLEKGDEIILYTDGAIDCENEENINFGNIKLLTSIYNNIDSSPEEQAEKIVNEISEFRNNAEKIDDITILVIKRN